MTQLPELESPLRVEGLGFIYQAKRGIESIDHSFASGKVHSVFGPNGSGKSTLLKVIAGILPPHAGVIYLGDEMLSRLSLEARARKVSYSSAELAYQFPLKVKEAVLLGALSQERGSVFSQLLGVPSRGSLDRADESLSLCGCDHLSERTLDSLSAGERQLVLLAKSVAQDSAVILFDETFSQMDLNHQSLAGKIMKELASRGKTVIFVSHDLDFLTEWTDEVVALKSGQVLASGPAESALTEELFSALYEGIEVGIQKSPFSGRPKIFLRS